MPRDRDFSKSIRVIKGCHHLGCQVSSQRKGNRWIKSPDKII